MRRRRRWSACLRRRTARRGYRQYTCAQPHRRSSLSRRRNRRRLADNRLHYTDTLSVPRFPHLERRHKRPSGTPHRERTRHTRRLQARTRELRCHVGKVPRCRSNHRTCPNCIGRSVYTKPNPQGGQSGTTREVLNGSVRCHSGRSGRWALTRSNTYFPLHQPSGRRGRLPNVGAGVATGHHLLQR